MRNARINEKFLKSEAEIGSILSWNEVGEIHKTRNGIYQKNEKLISLLTDFGKINPCYPDFEGKTSETIFYTGAGSKTRRSETRCAESGDVCSD